MDEHDRRGAGEAETRAGLPRVGETDSPWLGSQREGFGQTFNHEIGQPTYYPDVTGITGITDVVVSPSGAVGAATLALVARAAKPLFDTLNESLRLRQEEEVKDKEFQRELIRQAQEEHEKFLEALAEVARTCTEHNKEIKGMLQEIHGALHIGGPSGVGPSPETRDPNHSGSRPPGFGGSDQQGPVRSRRF